MELNKHADTILSKADEVGAVVIMRVDEYTKEDKQQLNNHEGYKKTARRSYRNELSAYKQNNR